MNTFLGRYHMPWLNQEETDIPNRLITTGKLNCNNSKKTKTKNSSKQKPRTLWYHRRIMKWNFWIPSNTLLLLFSCKAMSDSFETPWIITGNNFLGNNTEVCCYFFLQGIFSNPGIGPTSPPVAGRFFTFEQPGKPYWIHQE